MGPQNDGHHRQMVSKCYMEFECIFIHFQMISVNFVNFIEKSTFLLAREVRSTLLSMANFLNHNKTNSSFSARFKVI